MVKYFCLSAYLFVMLFIPSLSAHEYRLLVLESRPDFLRLKVEFDEPEMVIENDLAFANYKTAGFTLDQNKRVIPVIVRYFNLAATGALQIQVLKSSLKSITIKNYFTDNSGRHYSAHNGNWVHAEYLGLYRELPVYALKIYPVSYDPQTQKMQWLESAEILISSSSQSKILPQKANLPKNDFATAFLINKKEELYQNSQQIQKPASQMPAEFEVNSLPSNASIFKITVNQTGIYKITAADLAAAGYPLAAVTPQKLQLYNKGKEAPVYMKGTEDGHFEEGDYFEFWGEKNEKTFLDQFPDVYADPFSDQNVYWLVEGPQNGLRIIEENGGISSTKSSFIFEPSSFREILHFEKDNHFERFGHWTSNLNRPSYEIDHWYYDSGIIAPGSGAYDFYLPHPFESGAEVEVKVALRGKTFYAEPTNPLLGHRVEIKIRGKDDRAKRVVVVTENEGWTDQNLRIISNTDSSGRILQSHLNNGTNRLEIDMFQSGVSDIVLLNWFEISYQRRYRAYQNFIKFHVDKENFTTPYLKLGDRLQINVDGFGSNDIQVYKLGISKIINGKIDFVKEEKNNSWRVAIQDEVFDTELEYVAVTESAKKKPLSIAPFAPWKVDEPTRSLSEHSNAAEYLIITNENLLEGCQKLKALKEADGLKVEIVTVQNIYDVFNHGIKSPLAIKDFLKYALKNWDKAYPLKYAVLVGKASSDYKERSRPGSDMAPTMMYQTEKFGAASSDYWYALLSGDDYVPDIVVGRIPATSNQQVTDYVNKIENYSKNSDAGKWRNSALFLSGDDRGSREYSTNKPVFRAQNLRLATLKLPSAVFAYRLNTATDEMFSGDLQNYGSNDDLIRYFDEGVSYVNFLGHGGGAIWADGLTVNTPMLFTLDDVDRLQENFRLPFITSMTCFTGAFENSGSKSLGEKMLLAVNKGAIAFLGSSGVGWMYNDFAIEWDLFDYLWNDQLTIGEAINLMKTAYLANPVYYADADVFNVPGYYSLNQSMVSQYNLLGDPALRIQKPSGELKISVDKLSAAVGDTVMINITSGLAAGVGQLIVVGKNNQTIFKSELAANDAGINIPFIIPAESAGQILNIKTYLANGLNDAHGFAKIAVQQSLISAIHFNPDKPEVNQPISFKVSVHSVEPITEMSLKNFRDSDRSYGSTATVPMQKVSDTLFQSTQPYPGFSSEGIKYFDVRLKEANGKEIIYRWQKLVIADNRPDLRIESGTIHFTGSEHLQLQFSVANDSRQSLSDVKIYCFADTGILTQTPFAEWDASFAARELKQVRVLFPERGFTENHMIKIVLDPEMKIAERNEGNNIVQATIRTDHVLITPDLGSSVDGMVNSSIPINNRWFFYIPAHSLSKSTLVKIAEGDISRFFNDDQQSGLRYIATVNSGDTTALRLSFLNTNDTIKIAAHLSANIDSSTFSSEEREQISFYVFDETLCLWRRINSVRNGGRISAEITRSGLYTMLLVNDKTNPRIEITANGRPLLPSILVLSQPSIGILLHDENGIDLYQSFNLKIDEKAYIQNGQILIPEELSYPDSVMRAKNISVLLTPKLSSGRHKLSVEIADINGNMAAQESEFEVTEGFDIKIFGNYPNPFRDKTILSFFIDSDGMIDDFSVKIYTVSGRLIRSRMLDLEESVADDNIRMNSYHELIWDGTDDDGAEVANGVYFMTVSGKLKTKVVKHTLKIAKLR